MWRRILPLAVAALLLLPLAAAEPHTILLKVVDQYGQTVSGQVRVEAVGGRARLYNATHWLVEAPEASALVRVELYNVTVWQGTLEAGKNYVVKASVVEMLVETPDPGLPVDIVLAGSGKRWRLLGSRDYRLYPVPVGTYRILVHGAVEEDKTIFFTGGTVEIGGGVEYRPALPVLAAASLPAIGYAGYRAVKRKKASAKKASLKARRKAGVGKKTVKRPRKDRAKDRTLADILDSLPG